MTSGTDELHFFYDAQNRPAVVVYNGTAYAYVKNLQGDIVAILDENGNTVVSYGYDAWGAPLWCTGELAETLGKVQPFRYRGYVFDEETGLYYLRSRYYNPGWGRFVNADSILTRNAYAYCLNSPLAFKDKNGHSTEKSDENSSDYTMIIIEKLEDSLSDFRAHAVEFDSSYPLPVPVASYAPEYSIVDLASIISNNLINYSDSYMWFAKQVALKGPWDLKNVWNDKFPDLLQPTENNKVMFLGELATSEDIGNFAYGFNGSAMGIPSTVLRIGAGAAQYAFGDGEFAGFNRKGYWGLFQGVCFAISNWNNNWGDSERDSYWGDKGIDYYKTYYGGE